jgi:signal transduction histidine kinase
MNLFKRFRTIQGSLLLHELSFVVLILITASVAIIWAVAWQSNSQESLRLSAMNSHTQSIRGELYRQLKEVFDASFLNDKDARDEYNLYLRRITAYLEDVETLADDSDETAAIRRIALAYSEFHRQTRQMLIPQNPTAEQKQLLDHQLEQYTFNELETAFSEFDRLLKHKQREIEESRQKWTSQLMLLVPLPLILAISLIFFSRRFVRNNLVRPLAAVMQGARRISKGDLAHHIPTLGVEDLMRLARAINTMADELASSRDKLVEAKKQAALGELVPLVAHNIRNPLAGIRAAAQVTLDEGPEPAVSDSLRDIIVAVDRLERWVTSLLTYLHPIKPHFSHHSLLEVADNAISLIELQLGDKQIQLKKQGWQRQAISIKLDINLMEQTVFNLAQNAIEASPAGANIVLGYHQSTDHVELEISDEGAGMRFDPVSEQVTDGEAKRLGCGLGIPFALKVIKQHGGDLIYDAAPGRGTRVIIRLPKLS